MLSGAILAGIDECFRCARLCLGLGCSCVAVVPCPTKPQKSGFHCRPTEEGQPWFVEAPGRL